MYRQISFIRENNDFIIDNYFFTQDKIYFKIYKENSFLTKYFSFVKTFISYVTKYFSFVKKFVSYVKKYISMIKKIVCDKIYFEI